MAIVLFHLSSFLSNAAVNVAILPFKAEVDDELSFMKDGILQIVSSRIGLPGKVYVLEESKVRKALENMNAELNSEAAQSIGYLLDADYLIMGKVVQEGDVITIKGEIVSVKKEHSPVPFLKECGQRDAIIPSVSDLAEDLRKTIVDFDKVERTPSTAPPGAQVQSPQEEELFPEEEVRSLSREKADVELPTSPAPSLAIENALSGETPEPGKISLNYWRSEKVSHALRGLAVGDADGDGKKEIVCITGKRILVYRKKGEALNKIVEYKENSAADFVRIDMADVNDNGIDEVFITTREGASLSSLVLEYGKERFEKIVEGGEWLFAVAGFPGEGSILLGQARRDKGFGGAQIERMQWDLGRYVPSGPAEIPAGLNLSGLGILGGKTPGGKAFVCVDNEGRLFIYDGAGEVQWKSENLYGGALTAPQSSSGKASPAGEETVLLPLRLITKDLNNDQKQDILLGKIYFEDKGLIRRKSTPEGGSIYDLQWNGYGMDTRWQTERLGDALIDYGVGDADNDGKDELVVGIREGRSRLTLRPQNYILIYEIS